ncbi:hypothetical protein ACH3VR_16960 [Microbacterium sp. B2969]|uniref:Peptidase n=1 Tax=Microbacterium alkaliflavum TaxID=3248839 RepID=A0ABW7QB07_9MICO
MDDQPAPAGNAAESPPPTPEQPAAGEAGAPGAPPPADELGALPPADQPGLGEAEEPGLRPPADPSPRRSRGAVVAISLLAVALLLAVGFGAWLAVQFVQAQDRISEQERRISDQQDEIEHQKDLIDEKESFGAAMNALMGTAAKFDGALMATIVPWSDYQLLVDRAWAHRWEASKVEADTREAEADAAGLETLLTAAQQEAGSNATGTAYESTIDRLGGGFVRSVVDEQICTGSGDGILGCVYGSDPYLVHFDAGGNAEPYMNDELRTGIAYHEFAHVLQFTNPAATDAALPAFDGDWEVMADCFALTFLDGWTLDHRIWVSSYEYWDVNIGYGQVCSESQRQTVRDWYAGLGVAPRTLEVGGTPE